MATREIRWQVDEGIAQYVYGMMIGSLENDLERARTLLDEMRRCGSDADAAPPAKDTIGYAEELRFVIRMTADLADGLVNYIAALNK